MTPHVDKDRESARALLMIFGVLFLTIGVGIAFGALALGITLIALGLWFIVSTILDERSGRE